MTVSKPEHIDLDKMQRIRTAYVRDERLPTFAELSAQHGIGVATIARYARDEGWLVLRTRRLGELVQRAGAQEMLLAAASQQRVVTDRISNLALVTLDSAEKSLAEIPEDTKVSTRINLLNTVSFTLLNVARSLKEAGVVGLPKALMDELDKRNPGKLENPDFLRNALQQINITVNQARGAGEPAVKVEKVVPAYPKGGVRGSIDSADTTELPSTKRDDPERELNDLAKPAVANRVRAIDNRSGPVNSVAVRDHVVDVEQASRKRLEEAEVL